MQNKTHCAYVPRPRRKQYIENVNGRQLQSKGKEEGRRELPHNAAVTQTLARAQIQLISTNFSNCSPKKKKEMEKEQRKRRSQQGLRAQSQIKRRQKIAKNQLKNFCRDGNGDTGTRISHAHHARRASPSPSPLPALYTHSRYRMSDKRNSKRKEEEEEKQLEKMGKNCELNPLAACGIPIGPMYPNVHPDMHMDMDCQWSCVSKCLSLSPYLSISLSIAHTHCVCKYVLCTYRAKDSNWDSQQQCAQM